MNDGQASGVCLEMKLTININHGKDASEPGDDFNTVGKLHTAKSISVKLDVNACEGGAGKERNDHSGEYM